MAPFHVDARDSHDVCLDAITACDSRYGWNLDPLRRRHYAVAIVALFPQALPNDRLQEVVVNYHTDHEQVDALRNPQHRDHDDAWHAYTAHMMAILRAKRLSWSTDGAIDSDDIAQFAYSELVRALPTYRYQSRFSTWVYKVVVQSGQRVVRHSHAAKRAERPASLEHVPETVQPVDEIPMEAEAAARLLQELVATVLSTLPDQRLAMIFQLWAIHDQHVDQIGRIVQLHPSRVRALLTQARKLLRQHPDVLAWLEPNDELLIDKQEIP